MVVVVVEVDVVVGATVVVVVVSNGAVFSIATADNELAPAKATTMATIVAAGRADILIDSAGFTHRNVVRGGSCEPGVVKHTV